MDVTVWAGVIGGFVGGGFGYLGARLQAQATRHQSAVEDRRWYASQVQLANVTRADRLREIYGKMAVAAISLRQVVNERNFIMEGETIDERDERHARQVSAALNRVAEVGGPILIEASAKDVREAYEQVANLTNQYFTIDAHHAPGADRQNLLIEITNAVSAMADKVIDEARRHLEQLETPSEIGRQADGSPELA